MRRLPVALLAWPVLVCTAWADDSIPNAKIGELKASTVYVKVRAGSVAGTGSGFVLNTTKDTVSIVTNNHVVALPGSTGKAKIEVVFHSGGNDEQTLPAELL